MALRLFGVGLVRLLVVPVFWGDVGVDVVVGVDDDDDVDGAGDFCNFSSANVFGLS